MGKLTFRTRLIGSVVVLSAICFLLAIGTLLGERNGRQMVQNVESTRHKLALAEEMKIVVYTVRITNRGALLFSCINAADQVRKSEEGFRKAVADLRGKAAELRKSMPGDQNGRLFGQLEELLQGYVDLHNQLSVLRHSGKAPDAVKIDSGQGVVLGTGLLKSATGIENVLRAENEASTAQTARSLAGGRVAAIFLAAGSVPVCLFMILIVIRATRTMGRIAADLSAGSTEIHAASVRLSETSQRLAHGASQQAAAIEETSASADEIASVTRGNAVAATQAAQLTAESERIGGQVGEAVHALEESMSGINQSSTEVAKIIKVIDGIAFQTNILALNAAVEAARAGGAGLGFAVVAQEVRNLAQRSASAAKDTALLIEGAVSKAHLGHARLETLNQALLRSSEIHTDVKRCADEIAVSSAEQVRGVEAIAKSVVAINGITRQTAAHSEESASASQELLSQADSLNEIVVSLKAML